MKMGRRKPITVDVVEARLRAVHGDVLVLDRETYVGTAKKATFVDVEFGRWEAWVSNVLAGHGHPKRGRENGRQTNLKRYGSHSPLGSKQVRKKIEATNLERYGSPCVWGSTEFREQKMLEKYGVKNAQQVPEIRARTLVTNVVRHGAQFPFQSPEIYRRMEASNVQKYGVKNPMQREDVRAKGRQTCIERYGVENVAQCPEIYERTLKSMRLVKQIIHWKTSAKLQCKASYEVAFVEWCNANQIDFDWQIRIKTEILTPHGKASYYFIDAYIKDGEYADTWIELKGTFNRKNGHIGKAKWEWFHRTHPNSQLWTGDVLKQIGVVR